MGGYVHIPWYATVFRGDRFEAELVEIAAVAMRYGATEYTVFRSRDDPYKMLQIAAFEDKLDFERYWYGPEFGNFRSRYSSWYQVPVVYGFQDRVAHGELSPEASATVADRAGNGASGDGAPA